VSYLRSVALMDSDCEVEPAILEFAWVQVLQGILLPLDVERGPYDLSDGLSLVWIGGDDSDACLVEHLLVRLRGHDELLREAVDCLCPALECAANALSAAGLCRNSEERLRQPLIDGAFPPVPVEV